MMHAGARYFAARSTAIMALATLAGCGETSDAILRQSAASFVRERVEGRLECAFLVTSVWPVTNDAQWMAVDGIDAMTAAGLVAKRPKREGAEDLVELGTGPQGRRWIRLAYVGGAYRDKFPPTPYLCFGRRHVVSMQVSRDGDDRAEVRYRYRIVDLAPWTRLADIRAAYPFVAKLAAQAQEDHQRGKAERRLLRRERWTFDTDHPDFFVNGTDGKGFGRCPAHDTRPESPCT